jgi:hypothetical protein
VALEVEHATQLLPSGPEQGEGGVDREPPGTGVPCASGLIKRVSAGLDACLELLDAELERVTLSPRELGAKEIALCSSASS